MCCFGLQDMLYPPHCSPAVLIRLKAGQPINNLCCCCCCCQAIRVVDEQLKRLSSEVLWRGLVATTLAAVISTSWATAGEPSSTVQLNHYKLLLCVVDSGECCTRCRTDNGSICSRCATASKTRSHILHCIWCCWGQSSSSSSTNGSSHQQQLRLSTTIIKCCCSQHAHAYISITSGSCVDCGN